MYKVFINEKPVFIVSKKELSTTSKKFLKFKLKKDFKLKKFEDRLNKKKYKGAVILTSNKFGWDFFKSQFKTVHACGGLVENKKHEFLFIFRNGVWDLPKGKLEKGESKKQCAVREIEEECGIFDPIIQSKAMTTYHTYVERGKSILKINIWYLMHYNGNEKLIPQKEEGIKKVKWISIKKWGKVKKNTYGSIIDILNEYQH